MPGNKIIARQNLNLFANLLSEAKHINYTTFLPSFIVSIWCTAIAFGSSLGQNITEALHYTKKNIIPV